MKKLQPKVPLAALFLVLLAAAVTGLLGLPGCDDGDEEKPTVPLVQPSEDLAFAYVDVAGPMGYTLRNRTGKDRQKDIILEAMPPGIAVGDFNGDGWMDLYCPNGNRVTRFDRKLKRPVLLPRDEAPKNALYWNRGGKSLEEGGAAAGVDDSRWSFGAVAGDIDNDGDTDIYLCNWGANRLYLNDGKGKFTDVALRLGAAGDSRDWSSGACLFDYDNDGDLDIYIAQYGDVDDMFSRPDIVRVLPDGTIDGRLCEWRKLRVYCGPTGIKPLNDVLLRNDLVEKGKLGFTNVSKAAGIVRKVTPASYTEESAGPWYGFQPISWDIDSDGHADLLVANDSVRNACWMNKGDGTFEDRADEMSLAVSMDDFTPQASMGINIADINRDGVQDVVISEFSHDQFNLLLGTRLPDGRVVYDEKASQTRIRELTFLALGWGTLLFDPDLDADIDIFFACGHVYPEVNQFVGQETTYDQYNLLILNERLRPMKFRDATSIAGPGIADIRRASRAAVAIDIDNDGDVDIATSELNALPCLLRCDIDRQGAGRDLHWVSVRLRGNPKKGVPLDPTGAEVTVVTGDIRQTRVFVIGSSFQCSEDPRIHFGLGSAARFDAIEVKWMNGETTKVPAGPADRVVEITLK
ncbi:MAG: CRTAC1 family protein [Planctomycetota bacterium]|jgi:hypothetical protein